MCLFQCVPYESITQTQVFWFTAYYPQEEGVEAAQIASARTNFCYQKIIQKTRNILHFTLGMNYLFSS